MPRIVRVISKLRRASTDLIVRFVCGPLLALWFFDDGGKLGPNLSWDRISEDARKRAKIVLSQVGNE